MLSKTAVYKNVRFMKKYKRRPRIPINTWANEESYKIANETSQYACVELASDFSSCYVEVTNIRSSEMLIPVIKPPIPPVPERIKRLILDYQQRIYEAKTMKRKESLKNTAVSLLIKYGVSKDDAIRMIKIK